MAGPGAGKTYFLVENIKNIIKTSPRMKKFSKRKLLCITYTNTAVNEIKQRLRDYEGNVEVSTIHGFIIKYIIEPYQCELKKLIKKQFNMKVPKDIKLTSQIEGFGILHGHSNEDLEKYLSKKLKKKVSISNRRRDLEGTEIDIELYHSKVQRKIKANVNYANEIKQYIWCKVGKLTHDEILYFGYQLLKSNSTIRYVLRVNFPFVFLDEFQDTNPIQTRLIEHLGNYSTIVGTIGDIAQSIYSYQGATPGEFDKFNIKGKENVTKQYVIKGNRRSTKNIVEFCNYIRQKDTHLSEQKSIKEYKNKKESVDIEDKPVKFIVGECENKYGKINDIIEQGGVVLLKGWADAFDYIRDISDAQSGHLREIRNSYFNTSIDIRKQIAEHRNLTWVKAFTFIHSLKEGYRSGHFNQILTAFEMYMKQSIFKSKLTITHLHQLKELINRLFKDFENKIKTVEMIQKFNRLLNLSEYKLIKELLTDTENRGIPIFDKWDKGRRKEELEQLEWDVSYQLFKEVFSPNPNLMTIHAAKGREWKKVVVNLTPNFFDKQKNISFINMIKDPNVTTAKGDYGEFARLFYVACSRAKEELYIHIECKDKAEKVKINLENYRKERGLSKFYDFNM